MKTHVFKCAQTKFVYMRVHVCSNVFEHVCVHTHDVHFVYILTVRGQVCTNIMKCTLSQTYTGTAGPVRNAESKQAIDASAVRDGHDGNAHTACGKHWRGRAGGGGVW